MDPACKRCDAKCCRYFCLEIDTPEDYEEFENIRWYLCHEGVTVHVDEGDWYLSVANACKMLGDDGLCRIYEDRPLICRTYQPDGCDSSGGDYQYEEFFETPQSLDNYVRDHFGLSEYRRLKAKHRRKIEKKVEKARRKAEKAKAKRGSGKGRGNRKNQAS